MARRRKRLESSIEDACVRLARKRGWLSRKMNGLGFRAWPDRLFVPPKKRRTPDSRRAFWVEFKREGEDLTIGQARMRDDLHKRGETVYGPIDTPEAFAEVFECENAR